MNSDRGFTLLEALIGTALAFLVILAALAATRGLQRLTRDVATSADDRANAAWALDRVVRATARAGIGVCPDGTSGCSDEAIEGWWSGALAVRGDLDRDDEAQRGDPERQLASPSQRVATDNGEIVVFLRRARGASALSFSADVTGAERTTLDDGRVVAQRDGSVEELDPGPADGAGVPGMGTLYRVSFVDDVRHFGSSRFRVVEPLVEDVLDFSVDAFDEAGTALTPCGGAETTSARACRASIARLRFCLTVREAGHRVEVVRELALREGDR